MGRRKVGPAYESSPAKRILKWINQRLLILMSSLIVVVIFWFGVDWVVDLFLNFLATSGDETKEKPFSSNTDLCIIFKLVGSLVAMIVVAKSQTK